MGKSNSPLATFKAITCTTSIPLPKRLAGILRDPKKSLAYATPTRPPSHRCHSRLYRVIEMSRSSSASHAARTVQAMLKQALSGSPASVRPHLARARLIAEGIWRRWHVDMLNYRHPILCSQNTWVFVSAGAWLNPDQPQRSKGRFALLPPHS